MLLDVQFLGMESQCWHNCNLSPSLWYLVTLICSYQTPTKWALMDLWRRRIQGQMTHMNWSLQGGWGHMYVCAYANTHIFFFKFTCRRPFQTNFLHNSRTMSLFLSVCNYYVKAKLRNWGVNKATRASYIIIQWRSGIEVTPYMCQGEREIHKWTL